MQNGKLAGTRPGQVALRAAAAVLLLAAALLLVVRLPAEAQANDRDVGGVTLTSPNPGELVITWDAPGNAPTDYRVTWKKSTAKWHSYKKANSVGGGNAFPTGTSHTVTGLEEGTAYKARARARYNGEKSGPWSAAATETTASTPGPTPEPTSLPSDVLAPAAQLSSSNLPDGCALENLPQPSDGVSSQSDQWLNSCQSVFTFDPATRYDPETLITGNARFYRLVMSSEKSLDIRMEYGVTSHYILLRDANWNIINQTFWHMQGSEDCHIACERSITRTLAAGEYIIEAVQHYNWDDRERTFTLHVTSLDEAADCSDDDSTGCSLAVGGSAIGVLKSGSDADRWSVNLSGGTTYVINVKGAGDESGGDDNAGTLSNPRSSLHDSSNTQVSQNDDVHNDDDDDDVNSDNHNSRIAYMVPTNDGGTFYIRVDGFGGAVGTYTVSVVASD